MQRFAYIFTTLSKPSDTHRQHRFEWIQNTKQPGPTIIKCIWVMPKDIASRCDRPTVKQIACLESDDKHISIIIGYDGEFSPNIQPKLLLDDISVPNNRCRFFSMCHWFIGYIRRQSLSCRYINIFVLFSRKFSILPSFVSRLSSYRVCWCFSH